MPKSSGLGLRRLLVAKKAVRGMSNTPWGSPQGYGPSTPARAIKQRQSVKHSFNHEFFKIEVVEADKLNVILKQFQEEDDIITWTVTFTDGKLKYREEAGSPNKRYILDEQIVPPSVRTECERIFKAKTFVG